MYYDTYRKKTKSSSKRGRGKRENRRSFGAWLARKLLRLLLLLLLLLVLCAALLYIMPASFMNIESDDVELGLASDLPGNRVNILLLGLDSLSDSMQRSDAIMVASVGRDGVRLLSLMRDTMVNLPEHGRHKLNAAYALGGPALVMRTVNESFHLNITNYVALDFSGMIDLIDAIGGVDMEIEDREVESLNSYAYKTYRAVNAEHPGRYDRYLSSTPFTQGGTLRLNGLFATGYTRIRYIDSDYVRVSRQRRVFSAIVRRFRESWWNPKSYIQLWNVAKNSISTNLSLWELISLSEKIIISGKLQTARAPMDDYKLDTSSAIEITDPEGNARAVRAFLYD